MAKAIRPSPSPADPTLRSKKAFKRRRGGFDENHGDQQRCCNHQAGLQQQLAENMPRPGAQDTAQGDLAPSAGHAGRCRIEKIHNRHGEDRRGDAGEQHHLLAVAWGLEDLEGGLPVRQSQMDLCDRRQPITQPRLEVRA